VAYVPRNYWRTGPLSGQQQGTEFLFILSYIHMDIYKGPEKVRAATIQTLLHRGDMLNEAHAFLLSSFLFPLSPPPSLKFHLNFLRQKQKSGPLPLYSLYALYCIYQVSAALLGQICQSSESQ
jgi:hypothetical protein